MLGYLSKFVLQMLPTISATVIGAYIVATWINPRTPPDTAKIAARPQAQPAPKVAYPIGQPVKDAVAEAVEVTSADTSADAQPAKAASAPDTIRVIPIVKQPAPSPEVAVSSPALTAAAETAAVEERRDANTLARAAIQRQRSGSETQRVTEEPVKPAASRTQQARTTPEAAQPPSVATVAPPLPPAVTIAGARYPQADGADPAASERPTPPAEIPSIRNPLSLHAEHRVAENPSPADDLLNATRSFFRALKPQ
jgi:hypothetical protein